MIRYRIRYWAKKTCKLIGFCFRCRTRLNYTRTGAGICPRCGLRH